MCATRDAQPAVTVKPRPSESTVGKQRLFKDKEFSKHFYPLYLRSVCKRPNIENFSGKKAVFLICCSVVTFIDFHEDQRTPALCHVPALSQCVVNRDQNPLFVAQVLHAFLAQLHLKKIF